VSDLNEQAEAVRILKDEQLGDMFELCHWVVNKTTCGDYDCVPPHIYRIAVGLLRDKQQEIESGAKAKDKR